MYLRMKRLHVFPQGSGPLSFEAMPTNVVAKHVLTRLANTVAVVTCIDLEDLVAPRSLAARVWRAALMGAFVIATGGRFQQLCLCDGYSKRSIMRPSSSSMTRASCNGDGISCHLGVLLIVGIQFAVGMTR